MFERYTERARRVLFFARYEASQLGSISIESEHLLLGLVREGKGLSGRLFARSHLSLGGARLRRLFPAAVLAACCSAACAGSPGPADLEASWTLEPSSPTIAHPTRTVITLRDPDGEPLSGARLRIEAHMPHPGMAPVATDAEERSAGVYEADVQFTMTGAWTMVASVTLADGRRVTRTLDVPQVR